MASRFWQRELLGTWELIQSVERLTPDLWTDDFAFLSQPRPAERTKRYLLRLSKQCHDYSRWQAWMREKKPRLLVFCGRYEH
jgi:hypothetical protein